MGVCAHIVGRARLSVSGSVLQDGTCGADHANPSDDKDSEMTHGFHEAGNKVITAHNSEALTKGNTV